MRGVARVWGGARTRERVRMGRASWSGGSPPERVKALWAHLVVGHTCTCTIAVDGVGGVKVVVDDVAVDVGGDDGDVGAAAPLPLSAAAAAADDVASVWVSVCAQCARLLI